MQLVGTDVGVLAAQSMLELLLRDTFVLIGVEEVKQGIDLGSQGLL